MDSEGRLGRKAAGLERQTIQSYHMQFLYGSLQARHVLLRGLCILSCWVTHASPLLPCRSPGLTTSQPVRLSVHFPASRTRLQVPEGTYLCPPLLCTPLPTLQPPTTGVQGMAKPEADADSPVQWQAGGVTHSARATSAVSSRNCFLRLVHTSFTVCWSRPTCQKPHLACTRGLAAAWQRRQPWPDGEPAGEGGSTPWGCHEIKLQRPGTLARVREGQSQIWQMKRQKRLQAWLPSPAPRTEAALR